MDWIFVRFLDPCFFSFFQISYLYIDSLRSLLAPPKPGAGSCKLLEQLDVGLMCPHRHEGTYARLGAE